MRLIGLLFTFFLASCVTTNKSDTPRYRQDQVFKVDSQTIQFIGVLNKKVNGGELERLRTLPAGSSINIYIQAIHGDPDFVVEVAKAMEGKKTTCFAGLLAGTAFSLLQRCDVRLSGDDTLMVALRNTVMFSGDLEAVERAAEDLRRAKENLTYKDAERLGLDPEKYYEKLGFDGIKYDNFDKAFTENVIDGKGEVSCSESIQEETLTRTFEWGFQPFPIEISACPVPRLWIHGEKDIHKIMGILMNFGVHLNGVVIDEESTPI